MSPVLILSDSGRKSARSRQDTERKNGSTHGTLGMKGSNSAHSTQPPNHHVRIHVNLGPPCPRGRAGRSRSCIIPRLCPSTFSFRRRSQYCRPNRLPPRRHRRLPRAQLHARPPMRSRPPTSTQSRSTVTRTGSTHLLRSESRRRPRPTAAHRPASPSSSRTRKSEPIPPRRIVQPLVLPQRQRERQGARPRGRRPIRPRLPRLQILWDGKRFMHTVDFLGVSEDVEPGDGHGLRLIPISSYNKSWRYSSRLVLVRFQCWTRNGRRLLVRRDLVTRAASSRTLSFSSSTPRAVSW